MPPHNHRPTEIASALRASQRRVSCPSLRAEALSAAKGQRSNLTVLNHRAEIAASLALLAMTITSFVIVAKIESNAFALSLSKGRSWLDGLSTNGMDLTSTLCRLGVYSVAGATWNKGLKPLVLARRRFRSPQPPRNDEEAP